MARENTFFPSLLVHKTFVADTKLVSVTQKMFLFFFFYRIFMFTTNISLFAC